jgi:hypothetical protein
MLTRLLIILAVYNTVVCATSQLQADEKSQSPWERVVSEDKPALWWRFSGEQPFAARTQTGIIASKSTSNVDANLDGVRLIGPMFHSHNATALFNGRNSVLKFADPGAKSVFDFDKGDAITIEAWVAISEVPGGFRYIVGKGRTNNPGFPSGNQSWALRLQDVGGKAGLSFLFRNGEDKIVSSADFHRWASNDGFPVDSKWHHVALSYEFGKQDSMRGYIDGQPVTGVWGLKGKTSKGPIADDDEVWVGSSMGVNAASTFKGRIDELAIYRKVLSPDRIRIRVPYTNRPDAPPMPQSLPPRDRVLVEVLEGVPDKSAWPTEQIQPTEHYFEPAYAFFDFPQRYSSRGQREDRSNPLILRASSIIQLPQGKHRFLLRTLRFGRVFLDGKLIVQTPVRAHRGSGHGTMYDLESKIAAGSRALYPGAVEAVQEVLMDGKEHELQVEIYVGGQKRRLELGETSLSIAGTKQQFHVLSPSDSIPLTDGGWETYERKRRQQYIALNQQRRQEAISTLEKTYWKNRHTHARQLAEVQKTQVPVLKSKDSANNEIDAFIAHQLEQKRIVPTSTIDDWKFLRRASFDVIGTPPSTRLAGEYFSKPESVRRAWVIDKLLADSAWADNWVGYWQDVLAENPNVVNPTLNNTGPFRWWIFESFLDNKPFDQFATELITMEGSAYFGGPAGFSMATENDAPFAAKAHIVGQAFLAFEMQCARCHDAPYHDFKQSDLFNLAAMLGRKSQTVPKTSTIPGGLPNSELVKVTLKPGQSLHAVWPFQKKLSTDLPPSLMRRKNDSREELAARVTSPSNSRFAQVIVNRLWHRYLGRGLVEPIDDWENSKPSHPQLLNFLAREFVLHGYDLKHVARLILNSKTYQRAIDADSKVEAQYFAGPRRRRLSAEQLVDSIFVVSGKQFRAGDMNIDVDGSRQFVSSLNLGIPRRAWMFSSTSNERDRPSLALPFAEPFISALQTFGWRASRQNPLSVRDEVSTVLQPAIIANGVLGRRLTRLSDDSAFVGLVIEAPSVNDLVLATYRRVLTREPSSEEREIFVELLKDGFTKRVVDANAPDVPLVRTRTGVGWSNHLDPKASDVQVKFQGIVSKGDPATKKLNNEWRHRYEDMLWILMNSPEFVFIP